MKLGRPYCSKPLSVSMLYEITKSRALFNSSTYRDVHIKIKRLSRNILVDQEVARMLRRSIQFREISNCCGRVVQPRGLL